MNPYLRYEKSLSLYSYQELRGKKVITLTIPRARCGNCRSYLDELKRTSQILKENFYIPNDLTLDIEWETGYNGSDDLFTIVK